MSSWTVAYVISWTTPTSHSTMPVAICHTTGTARPVGPPPPLALAGGASMAARSMSETNAESRGCVSSRVSVTMAASYPIAGMGMPLLRTASVLSAPPPIDTRSASPGASRSIRERGPAKRPVPCNTTVAVTLVWSFGSSWNHLRSV
ncbi:MAG: hypothetical protein J3K34DRAFT_404461 [Monoraphidium minutum]|nr:MAG: hypothetical protein J3K34DRAFT_404461 [Monoraphidium minutum]